MHKKTSKRSIPLTEKIKHPQPSTSMTVHHIEKSGIKNHCSTVSALNLNKKTVKNISQHDVNLWTKPDDDSWSWDRRSSGTSISWPEEMEEVATKKVIEQWEAVERTLYDEDNQVTSESLRAECIQWRTQRPHLRVLGKSFKGQENVDESIEDPSSAKIKAKYNPSNVEEIIEEHKIVTNAPEDSPVESFREQMKKKVLDLILEFVYAEFSSNKKNDESLSQNLDTVLRITPAPTCSGRNPLRNHTAVNESVIPLHRKTELRNDDKKNCFDGHEVPEHLPEVNKNNFHTEKIGKSFVGGSIMPISARRQRDIRDMAADGILINRERLYTPQLPRNALGTVFTEKIIVSPVPFATTTKESFSTLKSTPLRSMRLSLDSSLAQSTRSARSLNSSFKTNSARRTGFLQIPQVHSAWQAPVCPTVWPKNIKLAPIDISRLPSSQRRSLDTALTQPRKSRNSLSPIPREIMPMSPLAIDEIDGTRLEVYGKQMTKQESRISRMSPGWDYSPRNIRKVRKKIQNNNER